jgi:thiamine biosynthesis lipoprotein
MTAIRRILMPALCALAQLGCAGASRQLALDGRSMGTTWTAKLVVDGSQAGTDWPGIIQAELDRVEDRMSHWDSASELSRFNRAAPATRHALSAELSAVLGYTLKLAGQSDGAFDPSVGALVNLWGFGPRGQRAQPPGADEIAQALQTTGWRMLDYDAATHSILQPGGVELDLSAAAPGYAVDRVAAALEQHGLRNFFFEIGGELRAHGHRDDGSSWRVSLQRPPDSAGLTADDVEPDEVLVVEDMAMGASGDYEHYFEFQGRRYPHTLDARTGYPVQHGLAAVHVLAQECLHADALASLLSVLGPDAGRRYALAHGVAARFVMRTDTGFALYETPAFTALRQARP